jgi:hypothetical protein
MSQYSLDAFCIEQAGIAPGPLDAYRGRGIHTRPDVIANKEEKKKAVAELVSQGMNAQRALGTKLIPTIVIDQQSMDVHRALGTKVATKTTAIDFAGNEVSVEPMHK